MTVVVAAALALVACGGGGQAPRGLDTTSGRWLAALEGIPATDGHRGGFAVSDWVSYWQAAGVADPATADEDQLEEGLRNPEGFTASRGIDVTAPEFSMRHLWGPEGRQRFETAFGFTHGQLRSVATLRHPVVRPDALAILTGAFTAGQVYDAATSDPVFGAELDEGEVRGVRVLGEPGSCDLSRSTPDRLDGCERLLAVPLDGRLVWANTDDEMDMALAALGDGEPSLADDQDVVLLAETLAEHGVIGFLGAARAVSVDEAFPGADFVEELRDQTRLSGYVAFGWGLGGDEAVAVVVYPDAARAEAQADRLAQLMDELMVRGESLTAGLDIGDVEVDGRVLNVTIGPVEDLDGMLAAEPPLLFSTG